MKQLLAWLLLLAAAPVAAADLSDALQAALSYDAQYLSAQAQYHAAAEDPAIALGGLLPDLSASLARSRSKTTDIYTGIPSSGMSGSKSISVKQPIFRVQNYLDWQAARVGATQAGNALSLARQDLILRLAQAWFDCLAAEDAEALARAQQQAVDAELAAAQHDYALGVAPVTDADAARARHDLVAAQVIGAENDLEDARRAVYRITGQRQWPDPVLGRPLDLRHLPVGDLAAVLRRAADHNLKVVDARYTVHTAELEYDKALAGHLPTLDLVGNWTRNNGVGNLYGHDQSIGLQLNIPLFAGGSTQAQVHKAGAEQEKSRDDAEDARRSAIEDAQKAWYGVRTAQAQVAAYNQAVASGQEELRSTRAGLRLGTRTMVDLLDAQQRFYSSQNDLAHARYDVLKHYLELHAAEGDLGDADINLVNSILLGQPGY